MAQNFAEAKEGTSILHSAASCALGALVGLVCMGCAGITVTPLTANGEKDTKSESGLRYYLPQPYLLVAAVPPAPAKAQNDSETGEDHVTPGAGTAGHRPSGAPGKGGGNGDDGGSNNDKGGDDAGSSQTSQTATSDTSFSLSSPTYMIKLVYLPDFAHPMAMKMHTGLFGTSTMKPAFQDGWMLTSLDASADSKVAETLTAISSMVGAAIGGGAGGAAPGGKDKGAGEERQTLPVLPPGLYKIGPTGVTQVTLFQDMLDSSAKTNGRAK